MKKIVLVLALLLTPTMASATDITWADKSTGGTMSAADANEIKSAVNSKQDELAEGAFVDGDKTKLDGIATGAEVNVYPGAGIPLSTGSAWGTSYTLTTLAAALDDEGWTFTGAVDMTGASSVLMGPIQFEGATADAYETSFSITDPTQDNLIYVGDYDTRIPAESGVNSSGILLVEGVENDLKTHTIEWAYSDVSATETGKYLRIPTGAAWQSAYSWCDASESALVYTLYQSTTLGGTFSSLGTIAHDAAAATDTVDISSFTDPAAGYWVRLDISTAGTGATACTLAIDLIGN